EDHAGPGRDGHGHHVGQGVVDVDELHGERAQPDDIARLHLVKPHVPGQAVLLQLRFDQAQGEPGTVDGHVQLSQDVGKSSDVVLVAVAEQDGFDAVAPLFKIGDVGDDQVDAQ